MFNPCGGGNSSDSRPPGTRESLAKSGFVGSPPRVGGRPTHRDILKGDVGDVVVGAALPGVVQTEG